MLGKFAFERGVNITTENIVFFCLSYKGFATQFVYTNQVVQYIALKRKTKN